MKIMKAYGHNCIGKKPKLKQCQNVAMAEKPILDNEKKRGIHVCQVNDDLLSNCIQFMLSWVEKNSEDYIMNNSAVFYRVCRVLFEIFGFGMKKNVKFDGKNRMIKSFVDIVLNVINILMKYRFDLHQVVNVIKNINLGHFDGTYSKNLIINKNSDHCNKDTITKLTVVKQEIDGIIIGCLEPLALIIAKNQTTSYNDKHRYDVVEKLLQIILTVMSDIYTNTDCDIDTEVVAIEYAHDIDIERYRICKYIIQIMDTIFDNKFDFDCTSSNCEMIFNFMMNCLDNASMKNWIDSFEYCTDFWINCINLSKKNEKLWIIFERYCNVSFKPR